MRYIEIQHSETGEKLTIDTYVSRYKRLGMGFLNSLKLQPRFVKHITLTQKVESYKPNILNPFFVKLRRFYGNVVYIWAAEIQEERLEKYGDSVLHWHIIVGFDYDIDFGKEDILRLQLYWKHGNLDCKPVRRASMGYLMKYISKSLDLGIEAKVRRIGSSMIAGYLRMSWHKFQNALSFFLQFNETVDLFSMFKWTYKGAFVNFGYGNEKQKVWVYLHPPSLWKRVFQLDDTDFALEPF